MPLDDRIRDGLRAEVAGVQPDVERHLDAVVRLRDRRRPSTALAIAATAVGAILVAVVIRASPLDPMDGVTSRLAAPSGEVPRVTPGPASSADDVVGTYRATLNGSDPSIASLGMAGEWELTLASDSSLGVVAPDGFAARADEPLRGYIYAIRGDELHSNLFARHLERSCVGSGSYRWHVVDGQLTLERIDDPCAERVALLSAMPWRRVDG